MKPAEAVRKLATCPQCGARIAGYCTTRDGRNHPERKVAALEVTLATLERIQIALFGVDSLPANPSVRWPPEPGQR